jgi:hypothetical protein
VYTLFLHAALPLGTDQFHLNLVTYQQQYRCMELISSISTLSPIGSNISAWNWSVPSQLCHLSAAISVHGTDQFHLNLVTYRQQYRCMELISSISTLSPVGSNIGAIYHSCKYSQKCPCRWASLSPETCRADSNRLITISINENCCILFVAYAEEKRETVFFNG